MKKEKQLAVVQTPSLAVILQKVVEQGITSDNVRVIEKMLEIQERVEAKDAEKQFTVAFNKLMTEIGNISATEPVTDRQGNVMYRWAPLHHIDKQLRPLALTHGFTYYWSEAPSQDNRVCEVCTVEHIGGHKRSTAFTVKEASPPNSTLSQGSMSSHSYAKRGSLINAFGIVIDRAVLEDDARLPGKPVGRAIAEDLMTRVQKIGADEKKFLEFCGVAAGETVTIEDYMRITDGNLDFIFKTLEEREVGPKSSKKKPTPKSTEEKDPETGEFKW